MEKIAFIQQHLVAKGVPEDLTKFNSNLWSKLLFSEAKPLVFQSPVKVFFKQGLVFGAIWGLFMWLFIWRTAPEDWMLQLVSTILFGCAMGGLLVYRVAKAHKKLGNVSWEKWCSANYELAP
ncbi:magnesium transporter [Vibrio mimicus]